MNIKVKQLEPDWFSRPRLINIDTNRIYVDISCGDSANTQNGIKGDWHTCSRDGEPDCPLRDDVILELD